MEKVAIVGLGYVGLPVALAFSRHYEQTIGFDIDARRIEELQQHEDRTREFTADELRAHDRIRYTDDVAALAECTFFVVCVPTPIDASKRPDLRAMRGATRTVAQVLKPGDVVVYESTVYPGVTEDICKPLLAEASGLAESEFRVGYSPERINPGDKEHTLERIVKVVAGEDAETLERVAAAYGTFCEAGLHLASSIKVAEAAKVIENTQRDLNIALMNELSILFDRLDIPTHDVLEAAGTKWNFLRFTPGLVGGHCIGVDPYYLTTKAEEVGYHPEVILAGRRINDRMGRHLVMRLVKALGSAGTLAGARVGILGVTFKEDVPDLRNSRIPDVVEELREYGIEPVIHDPWADAGEAEHELGLTLQDWSEWDQLDAVIFAVPHRRYMDLGLEAILRPLGGEGVFFDVKSRFTDGQLPEGIRRLAL